MKNRKWLAFFGTLLVAGLMLFTAAYFGASRWMGAHPFWDKQVVLIGSGIGGILAWFMTLMRPRFLVSMAFSIVLLGLTLGATSFGKARFVASFAEDGVSGKIWYIGSIATSAAAFICLFVVLFALFSKFYKPSTN